ncbi:MAG: hypothetical protein PWR01_4219, partial [Clostridiales bacterium]|nr:hypothetical protein [Clostridiales bacterium]MDN5283146.1 hypothetical protein [Candidatus Ozemobacter sp.]
MKKLFVLVMVIFLHSCLFAEKLFQYRGIFPAKRAVDAVITNYILLKKDTKVTFAIEEQGKGPSDRIKISRVMLTSNPDIAISPEETIDEFTVQETGIYKVDLEPAVTGGGEIRFILKVIEKSPDEKTESKPKPDVTPKSETDLQAVGKSDTDAAAKPVSDDSEKSENKAYQPDRVVRDLANLPINKVQIGKIQTVSDIDRPEPTEDDKAPAKIQSPMNRQIVASLPVTLMPATGTNSIMTAASESVPVQNDNANFEIVSPRPGHYLNPFNGIQFSCGSDLIDCEAFVKQNIEVTQLNIDGSKSPVAGQIFSPGPQLVSFLPNKLEPGSVYTVEKKGDKGWKKRFAAFPELKCLGVGKDSKMQVKLFWNQIDKLLPNPLGQVIKLENAVIDIKIGENRIFYLDV